MNTQKACHVVEELLAKESKVARGNLTTREFFAINQIMLEMQLSGKHSPKASYGGDAK